MPTFRCSNTRSGGLWSGGLDSKRGANRDQHSRDQRPRSGGLWSGGLDSKRGANRDQHSRDQRPRSGGLWSGGLDPKRGANRDQHSRDQRGCWFFKGWGIVIIPHRPNVLVVKQRLNTLKIIYHG
nr:hypothetical protein [Tanacetum cinerariifolium]